LYLYFSFLEGYLRPVPRKYGDENEAFISHLCNKTLQDEEQEKFHQALLLSEKQLN
jgi:hypothetical protein